MGFLLKCSDHILYGDPGSLIGTSLFFGQHSTKCWVFELQIEFGDTVWQNLHSLQNVPLLLHTLVSQQRLNLVSSCDAHCLNVDGKLIKTGLLALDEPQKLLLNLGFGIFESDGNG
ncbi:hypothetical protein TGPRC2_270290 [Toxoplasma gondii TgCatPRC2]|uniref:Uncharacterized protein n=3 Tax=Toxoplasma gondii TaxID=5811 RepID=A0A151HNR3_TOXGO|nr:hypothetical protein TGME49_270290 [Toxoplasma gondii ME49]EPT28410.1 hypothetical protein TGME49_270290 [Toxoplasma gondii ME49]KYF46724.1 hypothetical protein TGARI_270290 [Toxoplasma gondii ARI]KYK71015.1 hypothetical protein TGPRC2_270290 [Toxoplasma gondii TgCatPRC2]|eukprot:XP_002365705.1 hypothetical protein TGME49_270290 [Toxoplasma gondii ME49]